MVTIGTHRAFFPNTIPQLHQMKTFNNIQAIVFDADDTLWDCQSYFEKVENRLCDMLSPWGTHDEISSALFATEAANMPVLGYGCKAFTLSVIECAINISHGEIKAESIGELAEMGKALQNLPGTPLDGVISTLEKLKDSGAYRLAVFTKGELLDQENKLRRSGLEGYFSHVEIVSDKTELSYRNLCRNMDIAPEEMVMVGNSFKSDIIPAITVGAYAIHIPFHVTWQLEHTQEFEHERLAKVSHFKDIMKVIPV